MGKCLNFLPESLKVWLGEVILGKRTTTGLHSYNSNTLAVEISTHKGYVCGVE